MRKYLGMIFLCLTIFFLLPSIAQAANLTVDVGETEGTFSFQLPGQQFAVLRYSTPSQSGRMVLYAADGVFTGAIDLSLSGQGGRLKVTTENLKGAIVDNLSTILPASPAWAAPEGKSRSSVKDFELSETPRGFAYSFSAPDADYVMLSYHSKQESGILPVYPQDESGRFSGEIEMPLTYARTLITVQVCNNQQVSMKEGQVRKGFAGTEAPEKQPGRLSGVTVCIDAGHQENGELVLEPIGPGLEGSTRGTSGMAQGTVTQRKESIVTLEVAYLLRDELLRQGADVVMTRTRQDEFHTNIERCEIARDGGADIMLRLHCDTRESKTKRGISVYGPLHSDYAKAVADAETYRHMGQLLIDAMKRRLGYELTEKTGFVTLNDSYVGNNWAEMTCFLVEMGYMSNAEEDQMLAHPVYQQWLAEGMAQGVYEIAVDRHWIEGTENGGQ